jgi:hypothetical protein
VIQLTHGFIEKARGYFGQMVAVLPEPKALAWATSEDGKQV